eukprot:9665351-Alexandrium_andersonii.AAC.1
MAAGPRAASSVDLRLPLRPALDSMAWTALATCLPAGGRAAAKAKSTAELAAAALPLAAAPVDAPSA